MQSIASEFNYVESTFVLAAADSGHAAHVRIFTPRSEVPFAGHPNIGTAFVLARRDPVLAERGVVFEERAGLVPISILSEGGSVIGAEKLLPLDGADSIYVYTRQVLGSAITCDVAARMFAPLDGIMEDPATGSATAAAAALLTQQLPASDADTRLAFVQGVEMGRASRLIARVRKRSGRLEVVRLGDRCVEVMEGFLET